jgi:hypothetical protein
MYRIQFAQLAFILATVVLAPGALAGPARADQASTPPKQGAVVFLESVITAIAANDYAKAWQTLHPIHQAAAPEEEYVACEELSPIPGTLESLVPVHVQRRPVTVAGLPKKVRGVAVTFRLRFENRAIGASADVKLTAATVKVAGRWTWLLPAARYELYRDDACDVSSVAHSR